MAGMFLGLAALHGRLYEGCVVETQRYNICQICQGLPAEPAVIAWKCKSSLGSEKTLVLPLLSPVNKQIHAKIGPEAPRKDKSENLTVNVRLLLDLRVSSLHLKFNSIGKYLMAEPYRIKYTSSSLSKGAVVYTKPAAGVCFQLLPV